MFVNWRSSWTKLKGIELWCSSIEGWEGGNRWLRLSWHAKPSHEIRNNEPKERGVVLWQAHRRTKTVWNSAEHPSAGSFSTVNVASFPSSRTKTVSEFLTTHPSPSPVPSHRFCGILLWGAVLLMPPPDGKVYYLLEVSQSKTAWFSFAVSKPRPKTWPLAAWFCIIKCTLLCRWGFIGCCVGNSGSQKWPSMVHKPFPVFPDRFSAERPLAN